MAGAWVECVDVGVVVVVAGASVECVDAPLLYIVLTIFGMGLARTRFSKQWLVSREYFRRLIRLDSGVITVCVCVACGLGVASCWGGVLRDATGLDMPTPSCLSPLPALFCREAVALNNACGCCRGCELVGDNAAVYAATADVDVATAAATRCGVGMRCVAGVGLLVCGGCLAACFDCASMRRWWAGTGDLRGVVASTLISARTHTRTGTHTHTHTSGKCNQPNNAPPTTRGHAHVRVYATMYIHARLCGCACIRVRVYMPLQAANTTPHHHHQLEPHPCPYRRSAGSLMRKIAPVRKGSVLPPKLMVVLGASVARQLSKRPAPPRCLPLLGLLLPHSTPISCSGT